MPEAPITSGLAPGAVNEPQAGTNPAANTQAASAGAGQAPAPAPTVEELQARLERETKDRQDANREAQGMRKRLKELEDAEAARTQATMTEQQKLEARATAAEAALAAVQTQLRETAIRSSVQATAARMGIVDPDGAYRLLDHAALKLNDSGEPTNTEAALKALLAEKPYLLGQTGGSSATNNPRGASGATREAELRKVLNGGGGRVFDANRIRETGGGVTFPQG